MVNLNSLIFGRNDTKHIVSCEVSDSVIELFHEKGDKTWTTVLPNVYWLLSPKQFNNNWKPLEGNLHYKYICTFDNLVDYYSAKKKYKDVQLFGIADAKEAAMVYNGFTYFKDLKVDEVSRLFFDIETTGLTHDDNSKILLISNTFVKNGKKERKQFAGDDDQFRRHYQQRRLCALV